MTAMYPFFEANRAKTRPLCSILIDLEDTMTSLLAKRKWWIEGQFLGSPQSRSRLLCYRRDRWRHWYLLGAGFIQPFIAVEPGTMHCECIDHLAKSRAPVAVRIRFFFSAKKKTNKPTNQQTNKQTNQQAVRVGRAAGVLFHARKWGKKKKKKKTKKKEEK